VDVFLEEMLAAYPNGVGLLAIDTMHAATVGMEENSTTDTGVVIHNLKRIKAVLGCAVILVHHANKLGDIRGSTALVGAADAVYSVSDSSEEQAEGGAKRFHAQKVADAADNWTLGFDLVPVQVNKPEEWERKSMAVQWRGFPFETSRTVRDEVVRILRSQQHDVPLDTIWGMNTLAKETTRAAFRKALEQMVLDGMVERRLLDPGKPEGAGNKPLYKLKPGYSEYRAWNEE
jgi:RecA-family ATPase